MPGHTGPTAYYSPTKSYGAPNLTYEMAMGVPPQDSAPVFHFRKRFGEIDWRKLSTIDVDRVARELDFVTLQENISTVAFCNIDAVSDLDPLFIKLFKLAQYTIEYLLHSQEYLQSVIGEYEAKLEVAGAEQMGAQERIQHLEAEIQKLKAENKKRRKMIEQQQMLIESGASSYYKCPHCEKAFMNASFLQGHMQRRHPGSVNYIGDVIAHSQREQSRLAGKLEDLGSDLQQERMNFESKLKKAEEDKTAWTARTRREMQRWKKEEEGKWRKELESMKSSFVEEITKLKAQETEYKKKISSLQQTMDERHSNLGELVDDIEGEKQRLQVYEERIRTLEQTNSEKQRQLAQLSSEMRNLKDGNKFAIENQKSLAESYENQLRLIKAEKQPVIRARKREITPAATYREQVEDDVDGRQQDKVVLREIEKRKRAKEMRPFIEQAMEGRLQQCGIDPKAPGISTQTLTNKLMVLKTERQQKAKQFAKFFEVRDLLRREVDEKTGGVRRRGGPPRKKRQNRFPSRSPIRSAPSYEMPSPSRFTASAAESTPMTRMQRAKETDKTMTRDELDSRPKRDDELSPWNSEQSDGDNYAVPRRAHPTAAQVQDSLTPTYTTSVPKKSVRKIPSPRIEIQDSWDSDLEDLLTPEPEEKKKSFKQLQGSIASKLENRTLLKHPVGGVDISGANRSSMKMKDNDSDEDFSLVSSLEESPKPAPRATQDRDSKVRLSAASRSSNTAGTSVWGSNQGKLEAKNKTAEQESDWDDDISGISDIGQ